MLDGARALAVDVAVDDLLGIAARWNLEDVVTSLYRDEEIAGTVDSQRTGERKAIAPVPTG